jgi:glyoxylase-like metal-dependent hydrolase (beta-lactamase superfamily II)
MANTYLLNEERMVVVDPGTELNVQQLLYYLTHFLKRPLTQIDLIVLTHLHPDHTAGVTLLQQHCHAPVAASAIIQQLAHPQNVASTPKHRRPAILPSLPKRPLPGVLYHLDLFPPFYERQTKLINLWLDATNALPGHPDWHIIPSPGHTPDSICLYNPCSKELLCGDTMITIQGGAPLIHGATNRRDLDNTLHVLRELDVHYLYPGHGRPILGLHPLQNVDVEW